MSSPSSPHQNQDQPLLKPQHNVQGPSIPLCMLSKPEAFQFIIDYKKGSPSQPEQSVNQNPKMKIPFSVEVVELQPSAKKPNFGRWSEEEKEHFLQSYEKHGKDWKKIAEDIGTRNSEQVRSHAQKYFARKTRIEEHLSQKMMAEYEIDQKIGRPKRDVKKVKYSDEVIEYSKIKRRKNTKGKERRVHAQKHHCKKNEKKEREMEEERVDGRKRSGFLNSLLQSVEKIVHG